MTAVSRTMRRWVAISLRFGSTRRTLNRLLREGHRDLQGCDSGLDAAGYFVCAQRITEEGKEAVFKISDGTEEISWEGRVVGVHATMRKVDFEFRIGPHSPRFEKAARAHTKSFCLEALKNLDELFGVGLRYEAMTFGSFTTCDAL